jgi:hypothetical protein
MVLLSHLVPTKMASRPSWWSFCIHPVLVTSLRVFPCQWPLTAGLTAFPVHTRMDRGEKQHGDWVSGRKNRLLSFTEVLSWRTQPPIDLFIFYIFLQQEGAEDIIDSVGYPAAWEPLSCLFQRHAKIRTDYQWRLATVLGLCLLLWVYIRHGGGNANSSGTKRSMASTEEMMTD